MTTTTYQTERGWSVADNGGWLPGIYDSAKTARAAARFDEAQLLRLAHVWRHDGEDRPATMADLATLGKVPAPDRAAVVEGMSLHPIIAFVRARLDEDEAAARAAVGTAVIPDLTPTQAKHLPDVDFLRSVTRAITCTKEHPGATCPHPTNPGATTVSRWTLQECQWPNVPEKVVWAKARKLIRRGLLDGCECRCRGDYRLTDEGRTLLSGQLGPGDTPSVVD